MLQLHVIFEINFMRIQASLFFIKHLSEIWAGRNSSYANFDLLIGQRCLQMCCQSLEFSVQLNKQWICTYIPWCCCQLSGKKYI